MGVPRLPLVAELRNGRVLAVGNEDRIEPESLVAPGRSCDPPAERARAAKLVAVRSQRDQFAGIARLPSFAVDTFELAQQPADLVAGCAARRMHARTTV